MTTPRPTAPATPVLAVSCRMLRSPSHESVTTDLSLFSVSTMASEAFGKHRLLTFKEQRGPSPNPDGKSVHSNRPADIPEVTWFDDSNDLIRSCAALSSALGIQKSFSTSDIAQLALPNDNPNAAQTTPLRHAVSELALNSFQRCGYMLDNARLEHASRSCSTWVAVGELASTSQLPSPHGGPSNPSMSNSTPPPPPAFTAADLIRSVNKKVRQNYIRRRLLTTYRALERLSQSEFNLDRLEAAAVAASNSFGPGPTELVVPAQPKVLSVNEAASGDASGKNAEKTPVVSPVVQVVEPMPPVEQQKSIVKNVAVAPICPQLKKKISINISSNITIHDIERERGIPLSKYERNMMIFNWLHSLDETSMVEEVP